MRITGSYLGAMVLSHWRNEIGFGSYHFQLVCNFLYGMFVIILFQLSTSRTIKGMNVCTTYPWCNGEDESILHCFILCPRVVAVWSGCRLPNTSSLCANNPSSNMKDIIQMLLSKIGSVAPIIMWNVWCTHNKQVFDGIQLIVSTTVSVVYVQLQVLERAFNNIIFQLH